MSAAPLVSLLSKSNVVPISPSQSLRAMSVPYITRHGHGILADAPVCLPAPAAPPSPSPRASWHDTTSPHCCMCSPQGRARAPSTDGRRLPVGGDLCSRGMTARALDTNSGFIIYTQVRMTKFDTDIGAVKLVPAGRETDRQRHAVVLLLSEPTRLKQPVHQQTLRL